MAFQTCSYSSGRDDEGDFETDEGRETGVSDGASDLSAGTYWSRSLDGDGFRCRPHPLPMAGRSRSTDLSCPGCGGCSRALAAAKFPTMPTTVHSAPVHSTIARGAAGSAPRYPAA